MSSVHDGPPRADVSRRGRPVAPSPRPDWPPVTPTDLPLDILLGRLEGVSQSSQGQYSALCPHHGDTRPSLSVCESEDHTILLFCHAGCPAQKVMEAVGLQLRHLFPSDYAVWYTDQHGRRPIAIDSTLRYPSGSGSRVESSPPPDLTSAAEAARWMAVGGRDLATLATRLGVPEFTLHLLRVGLLGSGPVRGWTFPERDGHGAVVGILVRDVMTGAKCCLQGSRRGLYLPSGQPPAAPPGVPFIVTEGATDLAALLGRGCPGIGRPAARPSMQVIGWLVDWLRAHPEAWAGRPVVVAGDNDLPGRDGAWDTALAIGAVVPGVTTAFPPAGHKDMRAWIASSTFNPAWICAQGTSLHTKESS